MTYDEARAMFPVLARVAYLNAGTYGPLSRLVVDAMVAEQEHDLEYGRSGRVSHERMLGKRAELRARLAALVSVQPEQIVLDASTTDGCNIVLAGLDLGPDDEIVTTTDEHFGLLGPLHMSGAKVVVAAPDADAILAAVSPRTKLIAISQVLWTTGQVLPVRALRDQAGMPILVDGAQSVGAIRVDAAGLDFLTISGQKWLCGPGATGALVVADPERLRVGRPSFFAQTSHEPDGTFVLRDGAERFDPNWIPMPELAGLVAALDQVPEWSYARASALSEQVRALLAAKVEVVTPAERATLVSFHPPGGESAAAVVARLAEAGVLVREIPGTGLIRVSVGWWTSEDDLDRLVEGL